MTPNTPAGGAVAWIDERDLAELQDGKQAKTVVFPDRFDERELPLYTQPPATVSADAVLALVAKWISDSDRVQKQRKRVSQARGAYCQALLLCADELEALTRGEK